MTQPVEVNAYAMESAKRLVRLINDSMTGHARQAADIASRASNADVPIDPSRELALFSDRATRDAASFVRLVWTMLEAIAFDPTPIRRPQAEIPPASNQIDRNVGPVSTRGSCQPAEWRRRGVGNPRVPAPPVTVTRDRNDSSRLDLCIEAGGMPRGLYEGTVMIGDGANARPFVYNVYVDW